MQQAYTKQKNGFSQRKQRGKGVHMECEQAYRAVPVSYLIPNGFPMQPNTGTKNAEAYAKPKADQGKAVHPPEYKELYKLWQRMQFALTAGERRQVFQLCEQTQDFKVENKVKNAFVVLQNTYAQMLERVANMQMEIVDNLEDRHDGATPPIQMDQIEAENEMQRPNGASQQNSEVSVQEKTEEKEENISKALEEEVMRAEEAQQKIDEFGLTQQKQIQRLCKQIQIHTVKPPRQRSVLEQIALMGRRQSSGIQNEKKEEDSSKPIKKPNTKGSDEKRVQPQNDRNIKKK